MAWLVLGEVPSWLAIAGGALCIGGVVVARSGGVQAGRVDPRRGRGRVDRRIAAVAETAD